jgi:hypothetical protein
MGQVTPEVHLPGAILEVGYLTQLRLEINDFWSDDAVLGLCILINPAKQAIKQASKQENQQKPIFGKSQYLAEANIWKKPKPMTMTMTVTRVSII